MDAIITWMNENKEWLFSGVGVFVISLIIHVFNKYRQPEITQNIQSGDSSINIQSGRDININKPPHRNNAEEEK